MQLRVARSAPRLVGVLVGVLAVACQLGAVLAIWINLGLTTDRDALLPWVQLLWAVGGIAALLALFLGLTADRRGPTIPLALLALLLTVPASFLVFLVSIDS
jgi:hypothetical protein